MRRAALVGVVALLASACELQEVTIAESDPFVVVESYLIAGQTPFVALHASAGAAELIGSDADVRLIATDATIEMQRTDPLDCLATGHGIDSRAFPGGLACYQVSGADSAAIDPTELFHLSVQLPDGSRLDGATRVPEQVALLTDAGSVISEPCYLLPSTQYEMTWSSASGAAAYVLDLRAYGVGAALEREGIVVEVPDPIILRGLAIGDSDTTIVLPREFGLFDRFSLDGPLLIALQRGIPEGVSFDVVVAAVDQNFVNWVRGGDFNPSGLIRTPSMFGDEGTGVVGSMTIDTQYGSTAEDAAGAVSCGPPPTS